MMRYAAIPWPWVGLAMTLALLGQEALFTWLGFIVPPLLNGIVWEGRRWSMFGINGGYYLVSLLVAALLITHLR